MGSGGAGNFHECAQCTWPLSDIDSVAVATEHHRRSNSSQPASQAASGQRLRNLCFVLPWKHGTSILVNFSCTTGRWNMKWIYAYILGSLCGHSTRSRRRGGVPRNNNKSANGKSKMKWPSAALKNNIYPLLISYLLSASEEASPHLP